MDGGERSRQPAITPAEDTVRVDDAKSGWASDRECLHALARGQRDALAPLMERHYQRVYRLALSYLRDPEEALDVVQETFVKAYQAAVRWDPAGDPAHWLTRIAINAAIDRYRRLRRRRRSEEPLGPLEREHPPAAEGSPERQVRGRELKEQLDGALRLLPRRQRAVLVLRHYEDMTLDEIGRALGMRLGTVKSTLHRALARLRGLLPEVRA